jgi:hypothetical protein
MTVGKSAALVLTGAYSWIRPDAGISGHPEMVKLRRENYMPLNKSRIGSLDWSEYTWDPVFPVAHLWTCFAKRCFTARYYWALFLLGKGIAAI